MLRSPTSPVGAYLTLFVALCCLVRENSSTISTSFRTIRFSPQGPAVCAVGGVVTTVPTRSRLDCSNTCRNDGRCTLFNFKNPASSQQPVCELFGCPPAKYQVIADCTMYKISQSDSPVKNKLIQDCLVIEQHINGTSAFSRKWTEFKNGFGSQRADFWIGLDRMHELTQYGTYRLRLDMQLKSSGLWLYAEYSTFVVDNETANYTLHIGGYNGTAGDAMGSGAGHQNAVLDGAQFTTFDRDNDHSVTYNCAALTPYSGGFWYNNCGFALIHNDDRAVNGMYWQSTSIYTLQYVRMSLISASPP